MKRLFNFCCLLGVLMLTSPAMAIDASRCADWFQPAWGDNVECLGQLDLEDMGSFVDGTWQWSAELLAIYNEQAPPLIWSPYVPLADMEPRYNVSINYVKLDNRRLPNDRPADSRLVFSGIKGVMIPVIWAMKVNDPEDICITGEGWNFNQPPCRYDPFAPDTVVYDGPYPITIYHIDWLQTDECNEICNAVDWQNIGDCFICQSDNNNDGLPDSYTTPQWRIAGPDSAIGFDDVISIEWEDGGEIVPPLRDEDAIYYYMSYSNGANQLEGNGPSQGGLEVFSTPFSKQAPLGLQTYKITLVDGSVHQVSSFVASNRVMPTVNSTAFYTDVVIDKVNKSGKIIKASETEVEVNNLTAKEIGGDDGSKLLLIQWAEPDLVMTYTGKEVRCRIWVGDGWFNSSTYARPTFLWIDVPLQTGSVVVPAYEWAWIKDQARTAGSSSVDIGGMYREQYSGYHNRGYFEGITIPID